MNRTRRIVVVAITALAVLLAVGGVGAVVADANTRAAAARQVVDDLVDFYATEEGYEVGARGPLLRSILADSISNDAPLPLLHTSSRADYLDARYGAFGMGFSFIPVARPWSPRALVAPVAIGAVLGIALLLHAAAGWRPREPRTRP